MEDKKLFTTRDLYLASTLVTLKFEIVELSIEIEGVKPKAIGYFSFNESPELKQTRSDYNQGKVLVEPRLFVNTMQSLKSDVSNASREYSMNQV